MYMRPMYTFIATIEYHPKVEFVEHTIALYTLRKPHRKWLRARRSCVFGNIYSESVHKFSTKGTNIEHISGNRCNRMIVHIQLNSTSGSHVTHHDSTSENLEKN